MPQRKRPITQRPKVEDEFTGNPPEKHGLHRQREPSLGDKGGLNKLAGAGGTKQNRGRPKGKKLGASARKGKQSRGRGPARGS